MPWHSKSIDETLSYFNTSVKEGLKSSQVPIMREKYGVNDIIAEKPKPAILLLLEQFNDPVLYILMVAAVLNAFLAELKDTFVIAAVVILNSVIGFIQERRASDALKALRQMAAPTAKVIRDGNVLSIPTTEVVVGDIVLLESGVRAPADARLIETQNLVVDESMLTGESFAIVKDAYHDVTEKSSLGDRVTMVYSGTIIQKGRGIAVVTNVGTNTEFGKISKKVAEAEETVSPLQIQIARFSKVLSIGIGITVGAIFLLGFLRHIDVLTMFLTSVGLAVSAIPEGLPVAVTITLSIGISQMAKNNAIVKKLAAVETLGSCNVICTDKTGTLTKNQMTVTRIFCGDNYFKVIGSGYSKEGQVIEKMSGKPVEYGDFPAIDKFAQISALCTESTITSEGNEWKITGDPTEAALMIAAEKLGFKCSECEVNVDIPFESENQLMAVRAIHNGEDCVFVKGAPENILARCKNMVGLDETLKPIDIEYLRKKIVEFSKDGLRVLALAGVERSSIEAITIDNLKDLNFIGFAGIEDAIRPEAAIAVKKCHHAGIRVVMITGDHSRTAQAVAKAVGIGKSKKLPAAINGVEIDELTDEELFKKVPDIDVYARVAPHHKYRIVKQLQRHNYTVAMTGDGVNDAPALKQADIGVAMGSGTDVAKEASHMILMDDNFATIVKAVRRGRVVLQNLQHIIMYILATSFGGLLTIAISVLAGLPLPVLPAQLLWINLVTDGTSTFPLGFEKEHGDVMVFLPRKKEEPLINKKMWYRMLVAGFIMMIGTLGVFYYSLPMPLDELRQLKGHDLDKALAYSRTLAFCVLAFFQIWNVQNSRSIDRSIFFNLPYTGGETIDRASPRKNPILIGVMFLAIGLQVSAVAVPFMNTLLDTVHLSFQDWAMIFALTFSIVVIIEIIKISTAIYNNVKGKTREDINKAALKRPGIDF
ncbi:HAD family hydrolase [Bacteroidetes/Chlorobi group bacterium ChocPot_Mid]|nr:MAG: HAD family hydrolase [Bacteroidetes/Chlorobi group bacterium ChocPot_Mid]